MMPKKIRGSAARAYHHGNLKKALLEAALVLLESEGAQGLSLRTAAARAGVSSAAPYRHFEDREALLAAVASVGFERLLKLTVKARTSARDSARLHAMARAYLTFAFQNKGLYKVMFTENHLAIRFDGALARNSTAAFSELQNAVNSQLINPGDGQANLVATALWAALHGAAMLVFERLLPAGGPPDEKKAREASIAVARLLIESLFRPAS